MAEDKEADSPDESASAARPDGDDTEAVNEEVVEEHVAPDDAREPTVEELEQLLEPEDSDDSDEPDSDDDSDDESDASDAADSAEDSNGELVAVGAGSKAGRAGKTGADAAAAKTSGRARSKKEKATPKQKKAVEKPKRTTPVGFVREAVGELRKVVYPTAPQLGNYFVVVLVFVLIIIGFVSLLDLGFGWLIVKVFS